MGFFHFLGSLFRDPPNPVAEAVKEGLRQDELSPETVLRLLKNEVKSHELVHGPFRDERMKALYQAVKSGYKPDEELIELIRQKIRELEELDRAKAERRERENPPQPALRLVKTEYRRNSWLGGRPGLPPGLEHPVNPAGKELDFLLRIHCPELPGGYGLPREGTLYFFYDCDEMPWGLEPEESAFWRVLYSTAEPVDESSKESTFKRSFFDFTPFQSTIDNNEEENGGEVPLHQLFGYPFPVQDGEPPDAESRLFLQLDSDDDAGWMWGDCGILYFWMKPEDLTQCRFDRVQLTLECY